MGRKSARGGVNRGVAVKSLKKKKFLKVERTNHTVWLYQRGNPLVVTAAYVMESRGSEKYQDWGNDIIQGCRDSLRLDSAGQTRDFLKCTMDIAHYEHVAGPKFGWENIPPLRTA